MQSHPRISVIIPAYNAASYIENAIASALQQTYPAHEIIVVDDGSHDETATIVSHYLDTVRLLQQKNGGPAAARNYGARVATGDWLAFLDADDTWLPNKLAEQIDYIRDDRTGLVHCHVSAPEHLDFATLWERNRIITSTALVRRVAFEELGGFDEDRAVISVEDYNLWLRLAASGWELVGCPQELCRYTPAAGSLSSQSERFVRAELANLEKLAISLQLDTRTVVEKRLTIHKTYGRELIYFRQMEAARRLLTLPLRTQPSLKNLAWWLVTFLPSALLDQLRRRSAT